MKYAQTTTNTKIKDTTGKIQLQFKCFNFQIKPNFQIENVYLYENITRFNFKL